MENQKDSITRLLEMLDNPQAYSEQELRDIINHDEDTRETYRLMVEAKRNSRRQSDHSIDVDAAWQRFENNHFGRKQPKRAWQKMAASFIGLLLVSGIALAAIHIVRNYQKPTAPQTEQTGTKANPSKITPADTLATDTTSVQPVIYDNIPLEKMLSEIAVHYDAKVTFVNDEVRQLRFHFVWNPRQSIEKVVSDLNRFERLHVTLKDNQLIVE